MHFTLLFGRVGPGIRGTLLAIAGRALSEAARTARRESADCYFIDLEVPMSGRRSHTRFAVASPWSGAIRMLRDVVVARADRHELLAITHSAAVVGEELSLDLIGGGHSVAIKVRVLESRPVVVDGTVRHRVRLALPESVLAEPEASSPAEGSPEIPGSTADVFAMMTLRAVEAG